ncbi:MAG TPA: alpha/beta hydrolase [Euzebyales bacterium]|nr:alpha/beta hydrolase [Euzebyales bacterium]
MTAWHDRVVDAGDVDIAVRDHGGDGPPVVLLHGAGGNLAHWSGFAPGLAERHRVVALDLRGHGRSGTAPWSWSGALADIAAVADALTLQRPAIVGVSLGGMLAALWAAAHPECPAAVNLDGHPVPGTPDQYDGMDPARLTAEMDRIRATFTAITTALTAPLDAAQVAALREHQRAAAERMGALPAPFVEGFDRNLVWDGDRAHLRPGPEVLTTLRAALDDLDLRSVYARVTCPLLVVLATTDLPEQQGFAELTAAHRRGLNRDLARLAAANPALRVVDLDGASHAMLVQQPERVRALIDGMLRP